MIAMACTDIITHKIRSRKLISVLNWIQLIKNDKKMSSDWFCNRTLFFNMATVSNTGTIKQKPRLDVDGHSYIMGGA